jgi:hypothetical protein
MSGGKISNNVAKEFGGGVLNTVGTFNMLGGEISNNTAKHGGGVLSIDDSITQPTFNMFDGKISNNVANNFGSCLKLVYKWNCVCYFVISCGKSICKVYTL